MASAISPVVKLDSVSKRFGERRALDRVSVTIHPGEFVAVIGRSGAGKTTLLRCLSCAIVPTEGVIWFGDERTWPPCPGGGSGGTGPAWG
jgi:ABC-type multidrug transport system ATPase subunit